MSTFVFISHANADKRAIRHIVDALIADGRKLWLDNPAAMGFTEQEIDSHFHRIRAGGAWRAEIDEALREAGAVLVCWSHRALEDRKVWHSEATFARTMQTLVACRIDDFDAGKLPDGHDAEQIPDLSPGRSPGELRTALTLLVKDVGRILTQTAKTRLGKRKSRPRDAFAPFLVDRMEQEQAIGAALETVATSGGVQAFFVGGPENECVDRFIERIERTSRATGGRGGRTARRIVVEWPGSAPGRDFILAYRRELSRKLGLPLSSGEAQISAALAEEGRPALVISLLAANHWRVDEAERMAGWLELWRLLGRQPRSPAAVPILCLKMPPAEPGWDGVPSGTAEGAAMSNADIWRAVNRLNRKPGFLASLFGSVPERASFAVPSLLHPVNKTHADTWLMRDDISGQLAGDKTSAASAILDLFSQRGAARHGVALSTFAAVMAGMFRAGD